MTLSPPTPTRGPDFAIQVAENEGMPPITVARNAARRPPRRLTGKLSLAQDGTGARSSSLWTAEERAAMRRPLSRLVAWVAGVAGVMASLAAPVFAGAATGPLLEDDTLMGGTCGVLYRPAYARMAPTFFQPNGRLEYGKPHESPAWAQGQT